MGGDYCLKINFKEKQQMLALEVLIRKVPVQLLRQYLLFFFEGFNNQAHKSRYMWIVSQSLLIPSASHS